MSYTPQDFYFRQAKSEGYLARSVYKLKAIDERYHLFRAGMQVVDLGAAPGSWTQYILEKTGLEGKVLAIDLQPLSLRDNRVEFYQGDVFDDYVEEIITRRVWSGLVSDMAPSTTGSRLTDQARSAALVQRSLILAQKGVATGGFWVAKLLEGPERASLQKAAQTLFREVFVFRPPATRKGSSECFLIGLKKLPTPSAQI
ncbi:MAG: RlmE family RNA methyltransferase [Bacteroidia bacterium]|nr:RlmE family RNA methyltransferase [Bacteroidia bacterium]MDW8015115.1 RlmE family RNA methyltransferase [Bacteroidia bacterium]